MTLARDAAMNGKGFGAIEGAADGRGDGWGYPGSVDS
jgi:hypothetical protein